MISRARIDGLRGIAVLSVILIAGYAAHSSGLNPLVLLTGKGSATRPGPGYGNAIVMDGAAYPLYPVNDPASSVRGYAVKQNDTNLTLYDQNGVRIWNKDIGAGEIFGGFEFDGDGWTDMAIVRSQATGEICGSTPRTKNGIDLIRGKTGQVIAATDMTDDICWTFGSITYPTPQWTISDVLFGAGTTLSFQLFYATQGAYMKFNAATNAMQTTGAYYYPSTSSYDSLYGADLPNPWGTGTSYYPNSQVANGLIANVNGAERLVFFTSGRVVQYSLGPSSASQLLRDHPFVTGGRTDLAGRNYGLVAIDPGAPSTVALLAGTSNWPLFNDMKTSQRQTDPWGGIERHVTVYDVATNGIQDRFYSTAHDDGDGHQYHNRIAHPRNPFIKMRSGASRIAYNVYAGGHWSLHISKPGAPADATVIPDVYLWDIVDLNGDGVDELVTSPADMASQHGVSGYYFLSWQTDVSLWDESNLTLGTLASFRGAIPELVPAFRDATRTTTDGSLHPVLYTATSAGPKLVLRTQSGTVTEEAYRLERISRASR